jgi:hypothetical protein
MISQMLPLEKLAASKPCICHRMCVEPRQCELHYLDRFLLNAESLATLNVPQLDELALFRAQDPQTKQPSILGSP